MESIGFLGDLTKMNPDNINLRIYKYPIGVTGFQEVAMPKAARILSVANQNGNLCLWALCDADQKEYVARQIEIIGTGHPISLNSREFIGTVIVAPFVWHVFERT